jgi:hypothetical protein
MRPSLKDYLRTGEVHLASEPRPTAVGEAARNDAFLGLLIPSDLRMWETYLSAGPKVQTLRLDLPSVREDFQTTDKIRFTYYALAGQGEPLRPVRADSQIQAPLILLLKWDDTGVLTVYGPNV